ncbi:MAG: hypothetical protein JW850_06340 [Thermoflexales bacterium]|nr:hypothetical protein [Thermoflexales bacterium]
MTIDQAFDASIEYYDDWMMKAPPNYSDSKGAQSMAAVNSGRKEIYAR